jgi:two-component system response regulator NreC
MQSDPAFAREALQAGAKAYVLKEAADDELVEAIRAAAAGDTYLNPRLGALLAAAPPTAPGPPDDLTPRELDVLRLIALGHTNTEIAGKLFLSVRTIETHRGHIQQKTRRTTRAELVAYALERPGAEQRIRDVRERLIRRLSSPTHPIVVELGHRRYLYRSIDPHPF